MTKFVKFEETTGTALTRIWLIKNYQSDFEIGRIRWFANWRRYIFEPATNCIFDANCLAEITSFLNNAMQQHAADLRDRKRAALLIQNE